MEKVNDNTYCLHLESNYSGRPTFNGEHLKLYKESPQEVGPRATQPENTLHGDVEPEYEVEWIIVHWLRGRGYQYFMRWAWYGPEDNSWATTTGMQNPQELLQEYKSIHQLWQSEVDLIIYPMT